MLKDTKPDISEGSAAHDEGRLRFCIEPPGPSLEETLRRIVKHQAQTSLVQGTDSGKADLRPDLIGFAHSGVFIVRNQFNVHQLKALDNFGYNESWCVNRHLRLLTDTTGDGYLDIVGFGEDGVMIAINRGNNRFDPPKKVIGQFSPSAGGWSVDRHPRVAIDLRNKGRTDILGFADDGIHVSFNNGDGTFTDPRLVLDGFSAGGGGWNMARHLRFLVDLNGNRLPDLIGFGEKNIYTALNKGDGTFSPMQQSIQDFTCMHEWEVTKHPRFVVDLTGDGKPDIIGFGYDAVQVALNDGQGNFHVSPQSGVSEFTYNKSWRVEKHPRFVVDLTGNKRADIVGFGEDGVWVSLNNGNGTFQTPYYAHTEFGYNTGWRVAIHPRFAVDLTGDGCADLVGFRGDAIYVAYNEGNGTFGKAQKLMDGFGDGEGWTMETIRMVAPLSPLRK